MSKAGRKKIITIETLQRTVIRQNAPQTQNLWCEFCQAAVEMISPELAAKISGVNVREVYRQIEKGSVHFVETESGSVFICRNSLN
jgi:hypothetical protein